MFYITITFRQGPTILDEDMKPVQIKRAVATQELANKLTQAAHVLDAMNVIVEREQKQ